MTPPAGVGGMPAESGPILWLIPAALALHNGEEAATFPHYLPIVRTRVPAVAADFAARITVGRLWIALAMATIIPLVVIGWALWRPRSLVARWSALVVQAVVALNVVSHLLVATVVLRGYSPGLVTAVLINAPLSAVLFRRAARERWLPSWSWWLMLPTAALVHGPGLIGLLLLA